MGVKQERGRVLVVEDDRDSRDMLEEALSARGFQAVASGSAEDAASRIERGEDFDVVLTDLRLGGATGLDLTRRVMLHDGRLPVVVITAFGSIETAVQALRAGAYDFITKPFQLDVVALSLDRAVRHRALCREVEQLRDSATKQAGTALVGTSEAIRRASELLLRAAASQATVLVTGESGTGKEIAARTIHEHSSRAKGPFVAINCGALPEALLESELFGHVKGAFTDAREARAGLLVRASGGTLFLDEIGDMPLGMQVKLLRVLQERSVRPVGGDKESPFDVRVVAATHRDLEAEIAAGRFRQDLFFRIHVIEVAMPPLRARQGDALVLATHFLQKHAATHGRPRQPRLAPETARLLLDYDWPGNVRELENCIERCAALAQGEELLPEDLPERIRRAAAPLARRGPDEDDDAKRLPPLEEVERRHVLRVMRAVRGNKKLAAEILGLDRSTLYRKLERWRMDVDEPAEGA